jgi:hypothetical protein
MSKVKPIPDGIPVVMPMLVCRDAAAEIEFCKITFNAVELVRRPGPDGAVAHAALMIGGAMIMIEGEWPGLVRRIPQPDGSPPGDIPHPVKNQFWGDASGESSIARARADVHSRRRDYAPEREKCCPSIYGDAGN